MVDPPSLAPFLFRAPWLVHGRSLGVGAQWADLDADRRELIFADTVRVACKRERNLLASVRSNWSSAGWCFLQTFGFIIAAVYGLLFEARSPAAATGPLILAVAVTAQVRGWRSISSVLYRPIVDSIRALDQVVNYAQGRR